jgi:hypothetical protein
MADDFVPVMGIRLRKSGEHTAVDAEIGGSWIEVIRERSDGEFCHIVEPSGMMDRYYNPPPPCGECHLKPGERCDICGKQALAVSNGDGKDAA